MTLNARSNIFPFDELSSQSSRANSSSVVSDFVSPFSSARNHATTARKRGARTASIASSNKRGNNASKSVATSVQANGAKGINGASSRRSNIKTSASKHTQRQSKNSTRTKAASDRGATTGFFATKRQEYVKAKASRAFEHNYAGRTPAQSSSRAALYTGRMGSAHRKSARIQSKGVPRFSLVNLFSKGFSTRFYRVAAVLACLVFAIALVYPAARDYYISVRTEAQHQAEYEALLARSEAIQSDIEWLGTPEGVEAKANRTLGWVKEGENVVYVSGVEAAPVDSIRADVVAGSVPAPTTWYSPVLDLVFGFNNNSSS